MTFTSENVVVFLAVLEHGSFSAAARSLNRVPSAVSMVIGQLEAELDLRLFDRTSRDVRPTDDALALAPEARQLAGQLRRLQAHALSLHRGLERNLTLAVAPELLSIPWSRPLAKLADEFPALEVDILSATQAEALRQLHDGSAQLALMYERPRIDERESFLELGSEVLLAVISPSHAMLPGRDREFKVQDLIDLRQIAIAANGSAGADARIVIARRTWRTDSHLATLDLVRAGLGWAFLPRRLVEAPIAAGELLALRIDGMSNDLRLWVDVVWTNDRPLGLGARRLIELMRDFNELADKTPQR